MHLQYPTPQKSVLQLSLQISSERLLFCSELEIEEMASEESNASVVQRYSSDLDSFDIGDTKVQHFGLLMKKPFGHKSTRWQRR